MVVVVAHLDFMALIVRVHCRLILLPRGEAWHKSRTGGPKVRLLQCRSRRIAPAQVKWGSEGDRGDESGAGRRNKSVLRESIYQLVDVSVWHINRSNAEDDVLCSRVVLMGKWEEGTRGREK